MFGRTSNWFRLPFSGNYFEFIHLFIFTAILYFVKAKFLLDADILESNLYEEIICTLLPFMSGK